MEPAVELATSLGAAWRDAVASASRDLAAGVAGRVLTRSMSGRADAIIRSAFAATGLSGSLCVVAVGALGRCELSPHSDLDLWFVLPAGTPAEAVDSVVQSIVYPLWDAKVQVGHAVRTVDELVELARTDLTTFTALLDIRLVAGDPRLFDELSAAADALFAREDDAFLARIKRELHERQARFGDTMYLLEPNVKNGEGGYRDLLVGLWACKVRYRIESFGDMVALGKLSGRQASILEQALDFYLTLRTALQENARRKNDRLTFEAQEAIGASLFAGEAGPLVRGPGGEVIRPAVTPAVEALMQRYFQHAKNVRREIRRLVDQAMAPPRRRPPLEPLDDSFALFDGQITVRDPEIFAARPAEMVRIFNVAIANGAELYGHTRDLIADQASRIDLSTNEAANHEFLRLLLDTRDSRVPSFLEEAHDLGVLSSLLPEFGPCTGRVQHDLYHVYTVDQHSLFAVQRLKELERGALAETLGAATETFKEVRRREPLYLGTLLHDVGKPLGKGHSESGARLARAIATRLGFSADDVSQTEFLVRKHLLLSHLSQRRDLNDVAMVANLAEELKDEETLRELYLLTVADMSMVAPDNLSDWKERLLRELFKKTQSHFRHGPDPLGEDRGELVVGRRRKTSELLGETESELVPWFVTLPDGYVAVTQPHDIARHVRLTRKHTGGVAIETEHQERRNLTEVTVCALDRPGFLADVAGVLWLHRIDILSAQIHSRNVDAGKQALDVFTVRDRNGKAVIDAERWANVQRDLERVHAGSTTVDVLLAAQRSASGLPPRVVPHVKNEIAVDNDVSTDFSVIDVFTLDRPGVLYTITRTLSELDFDIQLSKVATEAHRVADVFYVRTRSGDKLSGADIERLNERLSVALDALKT